MVNGELGKQNLLGALRPGPLTAALLQFTIQNCPAPQRPVSGPQSPG